MRQKNTSLTPFQCILEYQPPLFPWSGELSHVPPPSQDKGVYLVQFCLDSQRRGGRLEYLVDWQGYSPDEGYWVPRDDILDPDLLTYFYENRPNQRATTSTSWSPAPRAVEGVYSQGSATLHLHSLTRLTLTRVLITTTCPQSPHSSVPSTKSCTTDTIIVWSELGLTQVVDIPYL